MSHDEETVEFKMILGLAGALRAQLGARIEDQPGGLGAAGAGQVNRAYRAAARYLLGTVAPPDADPATLLGRTLARAARHRLAEGGLADAEVEYLLGHAEGGGRDDWHAFLLLAPWEEVLHLLGEGASGAD